MVVGMTLAIALHLESLLVLLTVDRGYRCYSKHAIEGGEW